MKKIVVSILIMFLMISTFSNLVFATDPISVISSFTGQNSGLDKSTENAAIEIVGKILTVVRAVGVTVAVAILMVIGIKYIIASAGDRADIKKYAMNYIIGALVLFAAVGIVYTIQKIIEANLGAPGA